MHTSMMLNGNSFGRKGHETHWEDLDEAIRVEGLLAGKPSGESQISFKKWLKNRSSRPV
ncbi:hypothetical protein [Nitrosomonas ureae]|uniref:Uncharacterized protein n=1 Tax=Nitrosomonas ureae TaxID=44577 RepID=A0A1H2ETP6_9PROT|nr:hypothetical protein [Nitrosomonas ureae]PXX17204.1 hypothetical protein C8R27_10495 [Nitrosomonas ureae]SDT98487.1 hypothetical protein SAMN05216406_11524 [Nitrosomonas ureae]